MGSERVYKKVEDTYGKNTVVVHHSKSGRIRFGQDYGFVNTGSRAKESFGTIKQQRRWEYRPLIGKFNHRREFVRHRHLVWIKVSPMGVVVWDQSRRRAQRGRIKDLERKDVGAVIGRINTPMSDPNWKYVREVQVKLAKDAEHGAWIDTDDLVIEHGVLSSRKLFKEKPLLTKAIDLIGKRN